MAGNDGCRPVSTEPATAEGEAVKRWKPQHHGAEWPAPEDGCAFVLGGSLHGEIVQFQLPMPPPPYFEHAVPRGLCDFRPQDAAPLCAERITAAIERYRREEFRVGKRQDDGRFRRVWFYVHEGDETDSQLIHALTELCFFKRDARREDRP